MQLTSILNSFGAESISPEGEIAFDICSKLTPDMNTGPKSLIVTAPELPLNAQHSPGRTVACGQHI